MGFLASIQSRWRVLYSKLRSIETRLLVAVAAIVLLAWGFLVLANIVQGGSGYLDNAVSSMLFSDGSPWPFGSRWLADIARDVTSLGSPLVLGLLLLTVFIWLYLREDRPGAVFLLIVVVGGAVLSAALKVLIARERPDFTTPYIFETSASFPSGHSLIAAAFYPALGMVFARRENQRSTRLLFLILALIVVLLVGVSRVLLGAHYPLDVLGGWAAGLSWVALCRIGLSYVEGRR